MPYVTVESRKLLDHLAEFFEQRSGRFVWPNWGDVAEVAESARAEFLAEWVVQPTGQ